MQAIAQFLSNFTKSASGAIGDLLSPARMVIFGTALTTLNKPMFAASGWVYASYGTIATAYWVTSAKVRCRGQPPGKPLCDCWQLQPMLPPTNSDRDAMHKHLQYQHAHAELCHLHLPALEMTGYWTTSLHGCTQITDHISKGHQGQALISP